MQTHHVQTLHDFSDIVALLQMHLSWSREGLGGAYPFLRL